MRQQMRTSAIVLALLASGGFAAAQSSSGSGQSQLNLTPSQERSVGQGLAAQPSQSAPSGYEGQVGGKVPDTLSPNALPNQVTEQVPETKSYLFVKLPDRVLLIDPATQVVAEIVMLSDTTGSGGNSSSGSGSSMPQGAAPSSSGSSPMR